VRLEVASQGTELTWYSLEDIAGQSSTGQPATSEAFEGLFLSWGRSVTLKRVPFAMLDLSPIIQSDASSKYPDLVVRGETSFTEQIYARIRKLRALESVVGMLNELTTEQQETFEAAVKRRTLFK